MTIVFFGTSNVALPVLEYLHSHYSLAAVVTSPDAIVGRKKELTESPVSVLAKEMKLSLYKPTSVKNNVEFYNELKILAADIFIVVSYGKILPKEIIEMPRFKTLNIHFSALPKYRGASPIQYSLLQGDTETATSIMIIDELLDHGPILGSTNYPIALDDNFITLSTSLAYESVKLLKTVLPEYTEGRLVPVEQNHSEASYTKIITKEDGKIDWEKTSQQLYNQFRAFYPWPGIWTTWQGKKIKILDCRPIETQDVDGACGLVNGDTVVCGKNTALQIFSLQVEGKNEMKIKEFLNGYQNFSGSTLGEQV